MLLSQCIVCEQVRFYHATSVLSHEDYHLPGTRFNQQFFLINDIFFKEIILVNQVQNQGIK